MSAGYLLLDSARNPHSVQADDRFHFFRNHQERFFRIFRENHMSRLDSLKAGEETRFDRSFRTKDIPILKNEIAVGKRHSNHACSSRRDPLRVQRAPNKLTERALRVYKLIKTWRAMLRETVSKRLKVLGARFSLLRFRSQV